MDEVIISEFKECADTILHCIALFNGDWHRGDLFIYSNKINEEIWKGYKSIQYHYLGKSIITKYRACNQLRCLEYVDHINPRLNSKEICSEMDSKSLSIIGEKIYRNSKIKRIIELLIEGTSTNNLVLKASIYSVTIETLTNIVYNENEKVLNPIEDDLAIKITNKLLEVIDEYSPFMKDESINIITKKIQNINKPINVDKLIKSFSILGIKLNKHDKQTIISRNKILHGSTPFKNFEVDKEKEKEFHLMTTKLRLLILMLLLKYIGYKGHVYNYYGHSKTIDTKSIIEDFIRIV